MATETTLKILFVDDDPNILAAMQRNFRKQFTLDTAAGPDEALKALEANGPFAVIVADMSMPVMNGAELLELVRAKSPDTVRIMLTGNADQRTAAEAVNRGEVFRFLTKPCTPETMTAVLETALLQHELIVTEKALLHQTLNGSLQVLTDILAMLDPEAFGQAQLRRSVAHEVATKLGIASTWDLEIAALLAEIGLVTLPPVLREKIRTNQALSTNERQLIDRIPEFSARLLGSIPRMEPVAQAVLYQNKNYDGSGFPSDGVCGAEIPLGARVLKVVDSAVRMHRKGIPVTDAIRALLAGPERYDLAVARALSSCSSALNTKPKTATAGMRRLPLGELAHGQLLLADIVTQEGTVLLVAGTTLNSTQLQRVRNIATLSRVIEPIAVDVPPAPCTPTTARP